MTVRTLAAAALLTALAGPVAAQPPENKQRGDRRPPDVSPSRLLAPFQPVVAKANESTVRVLNDGKEAALGTVVFADGYVLTKLSELRGDVSVKFVDGSTAKADLVGAHSPTDLALLKVDKAGLVPLTFGDSKVAALGNWLAAAGVGSDPTAVGIVSVVTRTLGKMEQGEHLNANRGFLGIEMALGKETEEGVRVDRVTKGGAADKAGLRAKDVIYQVNGKAIPGSEAMREMLNDFRPGDRVTLGVKRDGEELKLTATLSGPPTGFQNRSDIQNTMGGQLSGRRGGFATVLQTDMVVDPRNCGGPVVDLDGRVVGLCIARAGRVETLVLPGEVIRPLLADLRAGRLPPRPPMRTSAPAAENNGSKPPAAPRPGGGDPAQGQRNPGNP